MSCYYDEMKINVVILSGIGAIGGAALARMDNPKSNSTFMYALAGAATGGISAYVGYLFTSMWAARNNCRSHYR